MRALTEVDRKEILRYLGVRGKLPDPSTEALVEECVRELSVSCAPRSLQKAFPVLHEGEGCLRIGGVPFFSRDLAKNMQGCDEAVIFAATLGPGADFLVRRAQLSGMSKAAVFQAAGSAMIEMVCDGINEEIRKDAAARGLRTKPRYSPGYGDLSLEYQRNLFQMMEITRRTGIRLSEDCLMSPFKSVTALVGLCPASHGEKAAAENDPCAGCQNASGCAFNRHKEEPGHEQ